MLSIEFVAGATLLYIALYFTLAYYVDRRKEQGRSIISHPLIYSLSIAVYASAGTFYGSVGKAATTGLDFILIYLGPSLAAFSWWFLLRKAVRIAKENNLTSIADFISSRYGKSQWLGAIVTIIAMLAVMPYIALQLKVISMTFAIITNLPDLLMLFGAYPMLSPLNPELFAAIILSLFGILFGARHLVSAERHEGLVTAIAVESVVKLLAFLCVGIFVTYFLFDGFADILARMKVNGPLLKNLTTFGKGPDNSYAYVFTMLFMSMGAIMLLPRQFHIMVIENSSEEHIKDAMWRFPAYLFLLNLFVMPIALGGIIFTGSSTGSDFFVLTLPMQSGHKWLALLVFLGGFSAAAGMVVMESVATSTMLLNQLLMLIVVRLKPRNWFPFLLINLKRLGIIIVIFLGYFYYRIVGGTYMLVDMGLISFAAVAQFGPPMIGALYWQRANKAGAITGLLLGFTAWFYTLLLPSLFKSGWLQGDILDKGLYGISFLKPTELFGLAGFDIWTHSMFWSMFFNIGGLLACSLLFDQGDLEKEQAQKFVDVLETDKESLPWETKRLSKPITIMQFTNMMAKFIGEPKAHAAISAYLGDREINENGGVSEFELPNLKRFIEKTLAGSVGAAAAGAIVDSYLSDIGSRMESVYDIYSKVRADLSESSENLFVRLRASEIMNRTSDLGIIMDDLLDLLLKEFKLDLAIIRLCDNEGVLTVRSYRGNDIPVITERNIVPDINTYIGDAFLSNMPRVIQDTQNITRPETRELMDRGGVRSFTHIPIARKGDPPVGVLSLFSRSIAGLFTQQFVALLSSLAGQLAQAVKIDSEMKAKGEERRQKELALLENARVLRDMEIAKQIQLSLLPTTFPKLDGVRFAGLCVPATHVGGDYYDFFRRNENVVDIVIADVSGHSVGAALIMAETRTVLRAQAHTSTSTSDILTSLNELLYEDLTRAELFITMFYVKYDACSRILTYSSAGHNKPILLRKGMAACTELDAEGLILGIKRDVVFEEKSIQLQQGDMLLLYTDGITEAENAEGEFFGDNRLCQILPKTCEETPEAIVERILSEVTAFTGASNLQDDISMVVIKLSDAD
ncbi:MAG: SpoIIE family protein phosphatase [Geobacteraceae bacterium]